MDLQRASGSHAEPRVPCGIHASEIDRLDLAGVAGVNVFRRFDLIRRWHEHERVSFDRIVIPNDWDRLHHSDWATDRIAWALFQVMLNALR